MDDISDDERRELVQDAMEQMRAQVAGQQITAEIMHDLRERYPDEDDDELAAKYFKARREATDLFAEMTRDDEFIDTLTAFAAKYAKRMKHD